MRNGYFDDAHREYVITDPRTPTKWINYVGTLAFGGYVDHTGGAQICKEDPSLNRITKYITQTPQSDFKGETLYIRVKTAQGYRLFSPFYVPCLTPFDHYACHVGLGYTRIVSKVWGIQTEVLIFVPPGEAREIRDIHITNLSGQPLELDVIPVVEYNHFDALKQLTNADWVPQTMLSDAHPDSQGRLVMTQYAFMKRGAAENYFTSNLPVDSYQSDRKKFLGANEYGTWANPLELQNEHLGNYAARRGDNIHALLHAFGLVKPGETRRLITQLGQTSRLEAEMPLIEKFRDPVEVDHAFASLASFWNDYLGRFQVQTPDPALNSMLNVHNPRQCHTTFNWSRYMSFYQLGYGSDRGIGYRDSSQDTLGVMPFLPEAAAGLIVKLLSVQRRDGSACHQFNPLNMIGSAGDSAEMQDRPKYYSDDALWSVLAVCAYLKESGSLDYLKQKLPFYDKDAAGQSVEIASVLEHICRALEFTHDHTGQHGLPLLGFADWNDTVNLPTGSESIFTTCLYSKALLEMVELLKELGDTAGAEHFQGYYQEMKKTFNQQAWDGSWYVAYFTEKGEPIGASSNEAGQIYAYPQAWSVISGLADAERASTTLESVNRMLNTRNGIKVSAPGYDGFDPLKGGITTYPPGAKENGGIFLHVNPWVIYAETLLGHGERAYQYYAQINPAAKNEHIEDYESEPYVYPQNILGAEHPQFGLARNSWLSGTAAWMEVVGTQYILGIRPTYQGLLVDPCIPAAWEKFEVVRQFRGAEYHIKVLNPRQVNRGVTSLKVDGMTLVGNLIPLQPDGIHAVDVVLG
jgi:cellobiose phosphorylase